MTAFEQVTAKSNEADVNMATRDSTSNGMSHLVSPKMKQASETSVENGSTVHAAPESKSQMNTMHQASVISVKNGNTVHATAESKSRNKNDDDYLCPCFPDKEHWKIKKPLIPLKLALFLWYASGAILVPFFNLYIIQLGISVKQLSVIFFLKPILQFISPTLSGIIADKIGRTKPVLVANLVLICLVVNSLLLVPPINQKKCYIGDTEISCVPQFATKVNGTWSVNSQYECFTYCPFEKTSHSYFKLSRLHAQQESAQQNGTDLIPENVHKILNRTETMSLHYNTTSINSTSFCELVINDNCTTFCSKDYEGEDSWQQPSCPDVSDNGSFVFYTCMVISLLFAAIFTNCYRFMDVTAIFMVKKYDSDFGRARFWSILGIAVLSSPAGYLVDLTTPDGAPRNCAFAFYFFDGVVALLMIVVYKLEPQIRPPGRNMWRKAVKLLKNLDVVVFALMTLALGVSWGFTKIFAFIYLDQLGSPSILMGVLLTVNSLCGLPFLMTSNWWIKTFGSSNVLVFGLLGYIFLSIGYSFLVNPWYALIYETSAAFTYHLMWVAVVRHSHEIAPAGLSATVVSCAGGIHFALGKGAGSLIGGLVMSKYGGRLAFRVIALICCVTIVSYGIYSYFRSRKIGKTGSYSLDIKTISSTVQSMKANSNGSVK